MIFDGFFGIDWSGDKSKFQKGIKVAYLDKKNIVVSIGSACTTSSPKASHVLDAIEALPVIKHGVVRVSLSDNTTKAQIKTFVRHLSTAVSNQFK